MSKLNNQQLIGPNTSKLVMANQTTTSNNGNAVVNSDFLNSSQTEKNWLNSSFNEKNGFLNNSCRVDPNSSLNLPPELRYNALKDLVSKIVEDDNQSLSFPPTLINHHPAAQNAQQ